jgi:hypothetical protein
MADYGGDCGLLVQESEHGHHRFDLNLVGGADDCVLRKVEQACSKFTNHLVASADHRGQPKSDEWCTFADPLDAGGTQ